MERQRIETPGGRVILGTFGPEGTNGWDLWVPAVCGIVKFHAVRRARLSGSSRTQPSSDARRGRYRLRGGVRG